MKKADYDKVKKILDRIFRKKENDLKYRYAIVNGFPLFDFETLCFDVHQELVKLEKQPPNGREE